MKRKILSLFFMTTLAISTQSAFAEGAKTLVLDIKGMSCGMCATKTENSIKKVDGVTKVTIDHKAGKGTVEYTDGKATPEQILDACVKTGFKCELGS